METKIILKAISSSGEPYDVHFIFSEDKISVFCNCPAGILGKLCKHKIKLLGGDPSMLFDKADLNKLQQIHSMIKKSNYTEIIASYHNLKKEIEKAQQKEKKLRKQIENTPKAGIEILS